jgi:hypothetical protein
MEQRGASGGFGSLADPPSEVRITIMPGPHERTGRGPIAGVRARAGSGLIVALVVMATGAGAILGSGVRGGGGHAGMAAHVGRARATGPPTVAEAYRYPLGCLGASLSGGKHASEARRPDPASPCWRYGIYVTAILRQAHEGWGLALEAVSPSCPEISLPAFVRAQLAMCLRGTSAVRP